MTQKHLTQIWQWASVLCLLFLMGNVISIQGGSEFVGRLFGDTGGNISDNKPAMGYFGTIVGSGLLLVASSILALHAIRHGRSWHERVPTIWLEGLNTSCWEAKIFQATILFIFLLLPIALVVKCIGVAESGDICELDTELFYGGSDTTLLWPPSSQEGNQMRLRRAGAGSEPCTSGIEIFPSFGTPFLIYGLPAISGMLSLTAISLVFRPLASKLKQRPILS